MYHINPNFDAVMWSIYVANLALVAGASLLSVLLNFYVRDWGKFEFTSKVQYLKYGWLLDKDYERWRCNKLLNYTIAFCLMDFLAVGVIVVVVTLLGWYYTLLTLLLVLALISPRYVLDLVKTLKYDIKTRESDRIKDMEKRIKELEER